MPLTPPILEVFLGQCSSVHNDGITVLTHPGDFFMGWAWFERFCTALGRQYTSLTAGKKFEPDTTAYPPRPGSDAPYTINAGDFFGGVVQVGEGRIVMRRSSSSDVHKPTMELQGLPGLHTWLNNKTWLSKKDVAKNDDTLRVEIKFQGNLVRLVPKKKGR